MSEFQVHDLSSNHVYRTELPNIIFEIGLKPAEIAVYAAIKRSAGDGKPCWKSNPTIAEHAGMTSRTLIKVVDSLCKVNKILRKPLIVKQIRVSQQGDNDTNLIFITDIWPENNEHFKKEIIGSEKFSPPGEENSPPPEKSSLPTEKLSPPLRENIYNDESLREGGSEKFSLGGEKLSHKEEPYKNSRKEEDARSAAKPPPSNDFYFDHQEKNYIGIAEKDRESWRKIYPDIDIEKEILKSQEWIIANPSKSKKTLWRKFLTGWFQRANDTAFNKKAYNSQQGQDRRTKSMDGNPIENPAQGRF